MLRLCLLISAVICSANLYAQQETPSPAVERILDKAVTEVKKNRQAFDEANQKPLGDARVELQDLSTKLISDGKTVDATAVLKQIETLEAEVMKMAKAPAPVPAPRPIPEKPLLVRMAGKWTQNGHVDHYEFRPDSTARAINNQTGVVSTNGVIAVVGDTATVKWNNGWIYMIKAVDDSSLALVGRIAPAGHKKEGLLLWRR